MYICRYFLNIHSFLYIVFQQEDEATGVLYVHQINSTITKNIDTDIHTETHFNEIFDPEFYLDGINIQRSRSFPTILMLSEDYDIETESITAKPIPAGKDITMNGTKQLNYILDIHFMFSDI